MAATGRAHALATYQTTSLTNKKCKAHAMSSNKEENDKSTQSFFWRRERSCHCKRSEIVFLEVLPREYSVLEMAVKRKWYGLLQPDIGVASAGLRVKEMRKGCLIFTFYA